MVKRKINIQFISYLMAGLFVMFLTLIMSIPIYWFERSVGNEAFGNLFDTLWYAYAALSTTGFGEIVPEHPASKVLTVFNYVVSRVILIIAVLGVGRSLLGRHNAQLNIDERFAVISHDLKLIHGDLYAIKHDHQQHEKARRRQRSKLRDIHITTVEALYDLAHAIGVCKNAHLHCAFALDALYEKDPEMLVDIKAAAREHGMHSISFSCGVTIKLQEEPH
ncbi:potassium channel family protein [Vibrio sp. PNB22_3_1]